MEFSGKCIISNIILTHNLIVAKEMDPIEIDITEIKQLKIDGKKISSIVEKGEIGIPGFFWLMKNL